MEPVGEFEYSKKDLIGHGAFAVVFKGRHRKKQDFVVAIKCITKKNLAKSQNLLSKEIKILRELSSLHHENVVGLLDCKETSHHVYLVMEYCNGGDLADFLQAKGTLSEDTIASFLRQIAAAMKALNAKGIVHRDLKPQNILLCNTGPKPNPHPKELTLKIADFGFARFLQDGVMAATLCGSPMYMAPEVIMSLQYDAKADLWSVGTIVYQCLTGKAPFQAQTPQQLKQFYERNANLAPLIQGGTSHELRDLLMKLLKRNAKDRLDFDEFFNHPFLQPRSTAPKTSSPVPVPRARSRSSSSESPPLKAVSASPLSGTNIAMSPAGLVPPQNPALQRVRDQAPEPMDCQHGSSSSTSSSSAASAGAAAAAAPAASAAPTPAPRGSPQRAAGLQAPAAAAGGGAAAGSGGGGAGGGGGGGRSASPAPEDFVMVQAENLPPDSAAAGGGASHRPPNSVDLNAIFSDNSPESPRHAPRGAPRTSRRHSEPAGSPQSPSRPSTLPVSSPVSSPPSSAPSSAPIPVPTQVKAFEQMQRSSPGSASPGRTVPSPSRGQIQHAFTSPQMATQTAGAAGHSVPIPHRRGSSPALPDVGSMSPPSVQFTIGTPPSGGWGRKNSFGTPPSSRQSITPPSNSSSPLRRSGFTPPRMLNSPAGVAGPSSLPTIVGSPTRVTTGFQFPLLDAARDSAAAAAAAAAASPSPPSPSPLQTAFGGAARYKTCPDNIAAVGFSPDTTSKAVAVRCATEPDSLSERLRRNSSGAKLSDQLWRAAFGPQISPTGNQGFPTHFSGSPVGSAGASCGTAGGVGGGGGGGVVVPYSGSPSSLSRDSPASAAAAAGLGGRERSSSSSSSLKDRSSGSLDKAARRSSPYEVESPTSRMAYCQSPPNMEGPISFVAPELAEETLMDKEHNETVAKLSFVLALVESMVELAQSRSSPITESVDQRQGNTFRLDHTSFISEGQRQLEQLVLYVRALQLLSSSIELAREEVKAARLQPSNNVKTIIKEMNNYYHQCLSVCRHLHNKGVGFGPDVNPQSAAITADKLIYSYAIDMCQTAALDELFGNPQDCFRRYRSAQILLHSLAQQAHNSRDRELINKYKESVEKRLYNLTSGGLVQAYPS